MAALVIVAGLALPIVTGDRFLLHLVQLGAIYYVVVAGLNLVSGYAGQLSVGHAALFGVGAYTSGILTVRYDAPLWLGMLAAIVVTLIFGGLLGVPSLRLRLFYFAMTTLGFALVFGDVVLRWQVVTGGWLGVSPVPRPTFGETTLSGTSLYYYVAAFTIMAAWLVRNLVNRRWGRSFVAVRENEVAAASMGISPERTKMTAFGVSAILAGVAGSVYASFVGSVNPDTFTLGLGLLFLVMMLLGGAASLWGPVLGVPVILALEHLSPRGGRELVIGGALMTLPILFPYGITGMRRWFRRRRVREDAHLRPSSMELPRTGHSRGDELPATVVQTSALTRSFGGVKALSDVALTVRRGTVHAVIGPNGSGKTTLLNVVSGYYKPDTGVVRLLGEEVQGLAPYRVARLGVGRTFQTPRVLEDQDLVDNVAVAGHAFAPQLLHADLLGTPRARRLDREVRHRSERLLEFVGLADGMQEHAENLPHGLLRFLEIARALLPDPAVVMLDEPAGGLSGDEIAFLQEVILRIRDAGVTVILVEHHVPLVMDVADEVTVLDAGRVIASGPPDVIRNDAAVIAAYLGES